MKRDPEAIELDEADLYTTLDQIEAALGAEVAKPFRQLLAAYTPFPPTTTRSSTSTST
jgi:hypothetical protein